MNTMSTTNTRLRFETNSLFAQHLKELSQIITQNIIRLFNQITISSIHHVSRSQTIVNPFTFFTQSLTHRTCESHHIMTSLLLNLVDTRNRKRRIIPKLLNILFRHNTQLTPSLRSKKLHFQVSRKLVFFCPDITHHWTTITFNHII